MKNITTIILFSVIIFFSSNAYSQHDTAKSHLRLKKVIKEKIIEKLNTDENTASEVLNIIQENKKSMKDLKEKRRKLIDDITENTESSDISGKFELLLQYDYQEYELKKNYINNLMKYLSAEQVAKVFDFQKELLMFMKKQLKKRGFIDDPKNEDRFDYKDENDF